LGCFDAGLFKRVAPGYLLGSRLGVIWLASIPAGFWLTGRLARQEGMGDLLRLCWGGALMGLAGDSSLWHRQPADRGRAGRLVVDSLCDLLIGYSSDHSVPGTALLCRAVLDPVPLPKLLSWFGNHESQLFPLMNKPSLIDSQPQPSRRRIAGLAAVVVCCCFDQLSKLLGRRTRSVRRVPRDFIPGCCACALLFNTGAGLQAGSGQATASRLKGWISFVVAVRPG